MPSPLPPFQGSLRPWLLVAAALWCSDVQAASPLNTEDASFKGLGECELESTLGREAAAKQATHRTVDVQWGCGIGFQTEVALGWQRTRPPQGGSGTGLTVQGKTGLIVPEDDDDVAWSIAWALNARASTR